MHSTVNAVFIANYQMKIFATTMIRKILSPSTRIELREAAAWLREQLDRACLWRWEIARLPQREDSPYDILYVGRKAHRELAKILLGVEGVIDVRTVDAKEPSRKVFVSEMPIPGALCVPQYLRAIVTLGRPIEEIMAGYDGELRRSIRKQRPRYHLHQALSDTEIDRADRELLRPYASARHGSSANQMPSEMVRRFALEFGRLDLVLLGDEVVACLLGIGITRSGKRYWLIDRFGYPEAVFSDPKRLRETNSVNSHLALEWAIENGFDYYDIGLCFARPDDGLLQWKRRRGAAPDTIGLRGYGYFYIRLPRRGEAQFLWDTPLFAVERHKLTLHLGLPDGPNDEQFMARYRQMGFEGLFKVYLHCAKPPSEHLLTLLHGLYKDHKSPPIIENIAST
jgi:hypothetical protein